ncbi:MAG TPA: copper chaperone PCu(A)C, partial [Eoetvoesiella sp.]
KNAGDKAVKLTGATAAAFDVIMLHQTTHEGGMSKMSMVHDISIPAGGELAFKPGSYHAMLEKPKNEIKIGARTAIDFMFDTGEKAIALCEIKPANTMSH